ncbi:MAG: hypothetical protein RSE13_06370 [Planktothrix sp. GU0601_MAG3]|nr:MAG: hypothetical protein RSE13_06370 [Planktothrix sp. GU0601_MAG3]
MDTLTFILNIACSVLSGIIVNLVKDNTDQGKVALKADIELEVVRQVREEFKRIERQPLEQEIKEITAKILEEINNLANKDPDLKFSHDKIELKKPVGKPILPFSDRGVDQEVEIRLERLKEIIAQRRKELDLPPESKEENLKDNLSGWEPVKQETETHWQKRINDSVRKIQIIHSGGEVIDE